MISLQVAILIAGIFIGIGLPLTVVGAFYFAYRMFLLSSVMKKAESASDAVWMHNKISGVKPPVEPPVENAQDVDISSFLDNPEAMERIRKNQDPADSTY